PYAATKAGGDMLCRAYYRTFKTPVVITHCSNNYGPYQYPEKLIPFLILRMLENKKLPIYGDGKNVRDWIYVLDHCEALRLCLLKGRLGEVYNIGADNEINNLQIADLILKYFNRGKEWIEFVFDRPGHDRRYAINDSKIKKELGWKPRYNFKKAFPETIKWYLDNKKWVDDVRRKTGVFNPHIELWKGHKNIKNRK
ncbi:MAG: GDP-mannose 4,6-dehydratase, partial [Patescibacteria group bacterium]